MSDMGSRAGRNHGSVPLRKCRRAIGRRLVTGAPRRPPGWSASAGPWPSAQPGSVTARPGRGTVRDVRSPEHRWAALALAVLATGGAGGCTGDDLNNPAEPELEPLRLGRVHVVLEPEHDPAEEPEDGALDDWDAFEVTARFAFVRGLEEDFVRARIDMPVLPSDVMAPGACVGTEQLSAAEQSESPRGELLLVDAGDLRMQVGNDVASAFTVPVSLVPDLLPYMSGVEYLYYSEALPPGLADDEVGGGMGGMVVVESQGSPSAELPSFRAEGVVPPALSLHVTEDDLYELRREALVLRWQGAAEGDEVVTLRLQGLRGGEPTGAELTCVLSDVGQARLSFESLRPLGLVVDAQALRATVSRIQTASFDAGDFVGSELFVERREELVLPL
jgi:hypothetical protein